MADRSDQQFGHYLLKRLIGEGGFAEVYMGEHVYLHTTAALKILDAKLVGEQHEANFIAEARLLTTLDHPHIIHIWDFGIERRVPYIVMSYAPNGTLRDRHPDGSRLPLEVVISYTKDMAEAIQFAHQKRLIHRDIKPENMLIGPENELLLTDFGIALLMQQTRTMSRKEVIGTVSYMAPEQIKGQPGFASDQYALAAVVYEWLAGKPAFVGTPTEIALQHMLIPPPSLCEQVPEIPSSVEQVINKALAKEAEQRFPDVLSFACALEEAARVPHFALAPLSTTASTSQPIESVHDEHSDEYERGYDGPVGQQMLLRQAQRGKPENEVPRRPVSRRGILLGLGAVGVSVLGGVIVGRMAWSGTPQNTQAADGLMGGALTKGEQASGKQLLLPENERIYRGHTGSVNNVRWSHKGMFLISSSDDATMHILDIKGRFVQKLVGHRAPVNAAVFSPDDSQVMSGSSDGTIRIWDLQTGKSINTINGGGTINNTAGPIYCVDWATEYPNALFSTSSAVEIYKTDGWQDMGGGAAGPHFGQIHTTAFSPTDPVVATATNEHSVVAWNMNTEIGLAYCKGHTKRVTALDWSFDGNTIVSGSEDGTVRTWLIPDLSRGTTFAVNGTIIYKGEALITAVVYAPDGKLVAIADSQGQCMIVKASNGEPYRHYQFPSTINALDWSRDGLSLAVACVDRTVRMFQLL